MIETPRLILKPATLKEAPLILELNADPEVVRYGGSTPPKTLQEAQNLIKENFLNQFEHYKMGRYMVYLLDGTFIGWCGLTYHPEDRSVELGYRLKKKFWGQGYATEASSAKVAYGFEALELKKIDAHTLPQNIASIRVLNKLGMTFRGMNQDPWAQKGYVTYDITSEEFKRCKR